MHLYLLIEKDIHHKYQGKTRLYNPIVLHHPLCNCTVYIVYVYIEKAFEKA